MIKGWFIGDFTPSVLRTRDFEVGLKEYKSGDVEPSHLHKAATEITLICSGMVMFNDFVYTKGSIVVVEPGEVVQFKALEDSLTVVVKCPSVLSDKYILS